MINLTGVPESQRAFVNQEINRLTKLGFETAEIQQYVDSFKQRHR